MVGVPGVGVGVPAPVTTKLVLIVYCSQSLTSDMTTGTVVPGGVEAGIEVWHWVVPVGSVVPPQNWSPVGKWKSAYIGTPAAGTELTAKVARAVSSFPGKLTGGLTEPEYVMVGGAAPGGLVTV